ncbi:nucleotidyltransferase family protein [Paenibacillus spongiae]|uniref:Nucleotidyltransferase family protein n=1 Tax=Paenibacillus spongiae TaxID=2909671 RepID=A0ABY5S299_9BACL|nr:nucleotidyltransferase family protein [Paenibacillus spongiae]UVI27996.1 nucleotidyltransferase family protein [Paenibacillus spongiae]
MERLLRSYIMEHPAMLDDLRHVRELELPDGYVAAGYIRNYVWDRLHHDDIRSAHNDVDVVYYDPNILGEERDRILEQSLIAATGNGKWSVKNQARMHMRNKETAYTSVEDALSRWPETATAIGIRLEWNDELSICCPYGLDDLFNMIVRRSPLFADRAYYLKRIADKRWKQLWPSLTIIED